MSSPDLANMIFAIMIIGGTIIVAILAARTARITMKRRG